jgi:hypothetical protein
MYDILSFVTHQRITGITLLLLAVLAGGCKQEPEPEYEVQGTVVPESSDSGTEEGEDR